MYLVSDSVLTIADAHYNWMSCKNVWRCLLSCVSVKLVDSYFIAEAIDCGIATKWWRCLTFGGSCSPLYRDWSYWITGDKCACFILLFPSVDSGGTLEKKLLFQLLWALGVWTNWGISQLCIKNTVSHGPISRLMQSSWGFRILTSNYTDPFPHLSVWWEMRSCCVTGVYNVSWQLFATVWKFRIRVLVKFSFWLADLHFPQIIVNSSRQTKI